MAVSHILAALLALLLSPCLALVTTTTFTTSRITSVLSPQFLFHPIYASVATANASAIVFSLDCEKVFDDPGWNCNGFTSLQLVLRTRGTDPVTTEATFTATSSGELHGTR